MVPTTDTTSPRDARAGGNGRRCGIGGATAVRGQIASREDLWIDGQFEGEIHAAGHQVTVGTGGRIRGEVHARAVIVEGELHGEAHAEQQIVVRAGGRMHGDARAPRIQLEDGCSFNGTVDTSVPAAAAAAAPAASAAPPPRSGEPTLFDGEAPPGASEVETAVGGRDGGR